MPSPVQNRLPVSGPFTQRHVPSVAASAPPSQVDASTPAMEVGPRSTVGIRRVEQSSGRAGRVFRERIQKVVLGLRRGHRQIARQPEERVAARRRPCLLPRESRRAVDELIPAIVTAARGRPLDWSRNARPSGPGHVAGHGSGDGRGAWRRQPVAIGLTAGTIAPAGIMHGCRNRDDPRVAACQVTVTPPAGAGCASVTVNPCVWPGAIATNPTEMTLVVTPTLTLLPV